MEQRLKLYYTSDTHGRVFPQQGGGGACLAACFAEYQRDENTLVLDGGDTLQGAPLLRYLWKNDTCPEVLAEVMNHGGLGYYTLGNHDFNYGYQALARYLRGVGGSCLCANVQDTTPAPLDIRPYAIHTLGNGLRVGIVGVVTEYVNLWEAEENLVGLRITDPFAAAKQALDHLKNVENGADYTICIYHGGFEEDITQIPAGQAAQGERTLGKDLPAADVMIAGESVQHSTAGYPASNAAHAQPHPAAKPQENVGCKICRELGFDLLLTAHQHMEQPLRMLGGTAVLQLPPNAEKYASLEIAVDIENCCSRIVRAEHITPHATPDAAFLARMQPIRAAADAWLAQPAGSIAAAVPAVADKVALALGTAKVAQLANFAQLQATGAQVAITALPNQAVSLPQQLTIGDVLTAYPFPNAVMTLAVSGEILAQGIARSASYFAMGAEGALCVAKGFVSPKEEHYNHDFFAGVDYTIVFDAADATTTTLAANTASVANTADCDTATDADGTTIATAEVQAFAHAAGAPIVTDIRVNGVPLVPAQTYTVAMSDYRATGTGGYDFYADCPCMASCPVDLQALILQTLAEHPCLEIPVLSSVTVRIEE